MSSTQVQPRAILADLHQEAMKLLSQAREVPSGRQAQTLAEAGCLRLKLVALRKRAVMPEHSVPGPVSIEVVEGMVDIQIGNSSYEVVEGSTLVLEAKVAHTVIARRDSVLLLNIAMPA